MIVMTSLHDTIMRFLCLIEYFLFLTLIPLKMNLIRPNKLMDLQTTKEEEEGPKI